MSTRSRIGILEDNGTVRSVYCHCDGYLSYNGFILSHYYNTKEKAEELISLGDISSLGKTTEYRDDPYSDECTRDYHRWRNEPINIMESKDIDFYECDAFSCGEEYAYLFKDGKWFVLIKKWSPVEDELVDNGMEVCE